MVEKSLKSLSGSNIENLLTSADPSKIAESIKDGVLKECKKNQKPKKYYFPPENAPVYNPTPIEELPNVLPKSNAILGDIDDISEDEGANNGEDTGNLLGSILVQGAKSGVLSNVDEFEQDVINNKLKLRKQKKLEQEKEKEKEKEIITETANDEDFDKIEKSLKLMESGSDEVENNASKVETEVEDKFKLEMEEAEKKFKDLKRDLDLIENKKKIMQEFYKKKFENSESLKAKEKSSSRDKSRESSSHRHKSSRN